MYGGGVKAVPPGGRFKADSVLQRASSQLRGERVNKSNTGDDEGVGAYLSALSQKTNPHQINWSEMLEKDEDSDAENYNPVAAEKKPVNKFLKKKTEQETSPALQKPRTSTAEPVKSQSFNKYTKRESGVLSKAAEKTRQVTKPKPQPRLSLTSDSDMDFDMSMDSEVIPVKKPQPAQKVPPKTAFASHNVYEPSTAGRVNNSRAPEVQSSSDSEFGNLGKAGNRFMKKPTTSTDLTASAVKTQEPKPANNERSMYQLPSAQRINTKLALDSDEESMQGFIQGLNSSDEISSSATPRAPRSPPTPKPRLQKSRSPPPRRTPTPLEDILEKEESHMGIDSGEESPPSSDGPVVMLMDLDSLEPAVTAKSETGSKKSKKKPQKKKSEKPASNKRTENDFFRNLGMHTVDELDLDYEVSEVSEVSEEKSEIEEVYEVNERRNKINTSPTPQLKSILSTPRTPKSSRGRVRLSLTDVRSRSPSPDPISTARGSASAVYTEDFDDVTQSIQTEQPADTDEEDSIRTAVDSIHSSPSRRRRRSESEYSDDFTSATETAPTRTSRRLSRSSSMDSDDTATYSDSYTSYSETWTSRQSRSKQRKSIHTRTTEVQTGLDLGSLVYQWNPAGGIAVPGAEHGLGFVDPTPVATHVVSPDALEVMTGYSPSVIALNDMLRQQLELTTSFMASQQRLYQSFASSLQPDFTYTTLEETKQYSRKHRPKTVSYEEALKQVKQEMGLKA